MSNGTTISYDLNGNMVTKSKPGEVFAYSYDKENRLTQVKKNSTLIAKYLYDGDGGRVQKTSYLVTTKTVSGGFGALTGNQQIVTTPVVTRYVGELYEQTGSVGTAFIFLGSQRVAAVDTNNLTPLYYHTDHLGSTNVISDNNGSVSELIEYDPYGKISRHDGSLANVNRLAKQQFTGKQLDDETGLIYFGARYYDPSLGRFITPDTIVQNPSDPQTLNRYSYCGNNPINRVDPTGHSWFKKWWKTIVTIAVGIAVGVLTAGIGTAFYTASLGAFWGGVASAATTGFIAGAVSGGLGAGLNGQNVFRGAALGGALGALSGAAFGAIGKVGGKDWNWKVGLERVGLSAVAGGGISTIAGGSFKDGAMFAGAIAGADFAFRLMVSTEPQGKNQGASMKTAKGNGQPKLDANGKSLRVDGKPVVLNDPKTSNVGLFSKVGDHGLVNTIAGESGPVMSSLGRFAPGFQGLSLAHDVLGNFLSSQFGQTINTLVFNFPTMPICYGLNAAGSVINDTSWMMSSYENAWEKQ